MSLVAAVCLLDSTCRNSSLREREVKFAGMNKRVLAMGEEIVKTSRDNIEAMRMALQSAIPPSLPKYASCLVC